MTGLVPARNPREARGHALARIAGITLAGRAVLGVSNGELAVGRQAVWVVVGVESLAALILGVSLCVLSGFARRRLPGASLGTWVICALSLPYLLLGLLAEVPGFAVQISFPGGNVVSTANLRHILDGVRPEWYRPLDVTLSVACVVLLAMAAWALAAAARPRPAAPEPIPGAAGTASEGVTACDPWNPTRVDESAADGRTSPGR